MTRTLLALLMVSVFVACGGGSDSSDPIAPPPPKVTPLEVPSGTFDVTAKSTFDGCDIRTVWDGAYAIEIDSLSFSMGSWTGSWNPKTLVATAESERDKTVVRSCTVTRWYAVNVTFSTADKFSGTLIYRVRLSGECGERTACTSSWTIVGTRQPAAP